MPAAILVLVLSVSATLATEEAKRSNRCYGDLGCFPTGGPFQGTGRLISIGPESPADINTQFMLYTRQTRGNDSYESLISSNFANLRNSHFSAAKQTKIVVHGFLQDGFKPWLIDMKDELLIHGDYNVILVDWGGGSKFPYTQATANTRVVGAEIAKLIKNLQSQMHARPQDFHIIGHSLGAHIAGYVGERTPNLGRISGLDPAGPYFENTDPVVRLDPTDAMFVDVMHTDAENLIHFPHPGFGTSQACGHVDYWPNSGRDQAGCGKSPLIQLQQHGFDFQDSEKAVFTCSHNRAHSYYIESINSVCPFEGYQCQDYQSFEKGRCLPCSQGHCGYMGFHADRMKPAHRNQNTSFYLDTGGDKPFCRYHYQIKIAFGNESSSRPQDGKLTINLVGNHGQLGEREITDHFIDIEPGKTYAFIVKATRDIGSTARISFIWTKKIHLLNPGSWSSHPLIINSIEIVNGERHIKQKFCGSNLRVSPETKVTLNQQC